MSFVAFINRTSRCVAQASRVGAIVQQRRFHDAAGTSPGDKVVLRGLLFHGYHGVYPEENRLGQKFCVDCVLTADLSLAGATDDLQHTVNYAQVYEDIKGVVEGPPCQLIEAVAERIAHQLLGGHPRVTAVHVGISKPHVAVSGVVHSLGVQIYRARGGSGGGAAGGDVGGGA